MSHNRRKRSKNSNGQQVKERRTNRYSPSLFDSSDSDDNDQVLLLTPNGKNVDLWGQTRKKMILSKKKNAMCDAKSQTDSKITGIEGLRDYDAWQQHLIKCVQMTTANKQLLRQPSDDDRHTVPSQSFVVAAKIRRLYRNSNNCTGDAVGNLPILYVDDTTLTPPDRSCKCANSDEFELDCRSTVPESPPQTCSNGSDINQLLESIFGDDCSSLGMDNKKSQIDQRYNANIASENHFQRHYLLSMCDQNSDSVGNMPVSAANINNDDDFDAKLRRQQPTSSLRKEQTLSRSIAPSKPRHNFRRLMPISDSSGDEMLAKSSSAASSSPSLIRHKTSDSFIAQSSSNVSINQLLMDEIANSSSQQLQNDDNSISDVIDDVPLQIWNNNSEFIDISVDTDLDSLTLDCASSTDNSVVDGDVSTVATFSPKSRALFESLSIKAINKASSQRNIAIGLETEIGDSVSGNASSMNSKDKANLSTSFNNVDRDVDQNCMNSNGKANLSTSFNNVDRSCKIQSSGFGISELLQSVVADNCLNRSISESKVNAKEMNKIDKNALIGNLPTAEMNNFDCDSKSRQQQISMSYDAMFLKLPSSAAAFIESRFSFQGDKFANVRSLADFGEETSLKSISKKRHVAPQTHKR